MVQLYKNIVDKSKVIEIFSRASTWELFLKLFNKEVHPGEFALKNKNNRHNQREWALSASIQRTFINYCSELGINGWFPGLEAPFITNNHGTAFVDITLFPWDDALEDKINWDNLKGDENKVRVELKWVDYYRYTEAEYQKRIEKMLTLENISNQHFELILIFHQTEFDELDIKDDKIPSPWKRIAKPIVKRPPVITDSKFRYFSLLVMQQEGVS